MLRFFHPLPIMALFYCSFALGQTEKYTISGYLEDEATGEKLIGANVFDPAANLGTSTNTYGFYSLTLPKDSVTLVLSYVGYQNKIYRLYLDKDVTINFSLSEGTDIQEVEVVAEKIRVEDRTQMSQIEIPIKQIKHLPALMGEVDVLKSLQLLPGVQSGSEGTSGIYVRGGSPDQNLILLDGVPVYNASHLFGFFSVFNADAIKNVTLTKGGFPARYGGRLSSVLEINMKEGNMKEFRGDATIGTVASKLTIEGPIVKDKTSFIVSGRRTYIDLLVKPFISAGLRDEGVEGSIDLYFYDLNAKINHKFSERDRLYVSAYLGDDVFGTEFKEDFGGGEHTTTKAGLDWGNVTSAIRWNRKWGNKLFSNTTLTYSKYQFNTGFAFEDVSVSNNTTTRDAAAFNYKSGIKDYSGRIDFDFVPNPKHYVKFGAIATHHTFTPGVSQFNIEQTGEIDFDTTVGSQITKAMEYGLYIEDDVKLGRFQANVGFHASAFDVNGKLYTSLQPRLGMTYRLPNDVALKASFATMTQYIHLLTNEGVGLPTDLWVPTTDRIIPEQSWQVALGVATTIFEEFEVSLEGYYKEMNNLVSYLEGASFFLSENTDWQDRVTQGDGDAYGIEFFLQRKFGKTTGWIGYTLAWSNRQFEEINGGQEYPFKYDRRHDISIVLTHEFTPKITASVVWVYGTGQSITLPESRHTGFFPNDYGPTIVPYLSSSIERPGNKNSYRMNPYHRLDVSVEFRKQKKRYERTIAVGVYNLYNRSNPFYLNEEMRNSGRKFVQYGLFPIVPSIAYRYKF